MPHTLSAGPESLAQEAPAGSASHEQLVPSKVEHLSVSTAGAQNRMPYTLRAGCEGSAQDKHLQGLQVTVS